MTETVEEFPAKSEENVKEGTLAWLALQPEVEVQGLTLPAVHRVPEGGGLYLGDDDGICRLIYPDGNRCRAARAKRYGLCLPHAGGGFTSNNAGAMAKRATAGKVRARMTRNLLGVSARRAGDPRLYSRLRAAERAVEIADSLLAPLDDPDLSPMRRQEAAVKILDATFPQQQVTVEVEMPTDAAGVQQLGWAEMQQLAAQLLGTSEVPAALEASVDAGLREGNGLADR